ncbi:tetratricopeptide repeat protein [Hufsiella ginkgonis]|uniref:Tetratricopeptide repeat protein n=1 Tax=Hufsiella ginkgonis TaxID=2695274 RepID=A0A7K1XXK9_9SPHI|nr:tetratricopeptide repeat protein [Hufsiella ginkgonis]MXV15730.1 tetratricopeptide repeat protein [Hufsiella ginkgonis]
MRKRITLLLLLPCGLLFAQEKAHIKKGNDLYKQQDFAGAEANYRKSIAKKSQTLEGNFNLGDALYKQKKFAEAAEQFNKIAGASNAKPVLGKAYHNMGNALLEANKLEESIAAYKKSLISDPNDDQTRYNLAYAQEKLKRQQQQDKKDQQNKDKNKDKDQQNNDKKDDKDKKGDKDKKDDNDKKGDKDKDKKDQDKNNQDKKDENKKDQQEKPQPNKLSKDDAERMLEALNNNEKETQDKMKNKKLKGVKVKVAKDW